MESVLESFKRVTGQRRYIEEIDGLRFLAIMPVLLMHFNTHFKDVTRQDIAVGAEESLLNNALNNGLLGVYVFFAISGFILALPFAKFNLKDGRPVDLGKYFKKRLTRLEPPYLVTLTVFLLVQVWVQGNLFSEIFPNYLASFIYNHNLIYGEWSVINPVAWTLEIEVQFYILVPLLTYLFKVSNTILRRLIIVLLGLISFGFYLYVPLQVVNLDRSILNHLHYFMAGFLFADIYLTNFQKSQSSKSIWYDGLTLISLLGLFIFMEGDKVNRFVVLLSILGVFIGVFRSIYFNQIFRNVWVTTIGGMCYIIYLTHYPFIAFLMKITGDLSISSSYLGNLGFQFALLAPFMLLFFFMAFKYLERPFMYNDWPERALQILKSYFRRFRAITKT